MLKIEKHAAERVAVLTMDHERENRFHPDLVQGLLDALDALEADPEVRAVVFTGADPKFFSNGLDLGWMMGHIRDLPVLTGYLRSVNALFRRVTLFPKPTVGALNGHTFAAGLFLAAHMDFRLMREDRGWICAPEVDINIPLLPGMIAICQATMSPAGFRKVYYTGARLTAPEAVEIGFVDRAVADEALLPEAIALAAELGKKRTATYAEMKRRVRQDVVRILDEEDPALFLQTLSYSAPPSR
ncbi:MAG: enoyl-CoA hydratase/isomerase family protein [Deltaproteobacteria bacterium]|nr:enoyl-CoA hydratase/isomerase family protein [Deltaproteobacteria bacterium]